MSGFFISLEMQRDVKFLLWGVLVLRNVVAEDSEVTDPKFGKSDLIRGRCRGAGRHFRGIFAKRVHHGNAATQNGLVEFERLPGCCQTNAIQSPLPIPRLGFRPPKGRATRREQRRGSTCNGRGSRFGAPSESGCAPRHALRRTSATFACAGTATSPALVFGMAGGNLVGLPSLPHDRPRSGQGG